MPRKRIIVGLLLVFIEYSQTGWYPISAIEKENNEMGNLELSISQFVCELIKSIYGSWIKVYSKYLILKCVEVFFRSNVKSLEAFHFRPRSDFMGTIPGHSLSLFGNFHWILLTMSHYWSGLMTLLGYDCKLSLVHGAFIWNSQSLILRRTRLAAKGKIGFTMLSTFSFSVLKMGRVKKIIFTL